MTASSEFDALGQHIIAEFYGARHLRDGAKLLSAMQDAAEAAGAVVIDSKLHEFGVGEGVTGVVLLAESHISIHTWPEHDYAAIDIFMCGSKVAPLNSLQHLREVLAPKRDSVTVLQRGDALASAAK